MRSNYSDKWSIILDEAGGGGGSPLLGSLTYVFFLGVVFFIQVGGKEWKR